MRGLLAVSPPHDRSLKERLLASSSIGVARSKLNFLPKQGTTPPLRATPTWEIEARGEPFGRIFTWRILRAGKPRMAVDHRWEGGVTAVQPEFKRRDIRIGLSPLCSFGWAQRDPTPTSSAGLGLSPTIWQHPLVGA
jgi:hypothetical protein